MRFETKKKREERLKREKKEQFNKNVKAAAGVVKFIIDIALKFPK